MTYPVSYYELPIEQHLQKVSVNTAEQVEPEFEERAPKMERANSRHKMENVRKDTGGSYERKSL